MNKKIYKDAFAPNFPFALIQISVYLGIFILFYIPIIVITSRKIGLSGMTALSSKMWIIAIIIIAGFLPILYVVLSIAARLKYGMYRKIVTDDRGITFAKLFRKKTILWNNIVSLGIYDRLFFHVLKLTAGKIKMAELQAIDKTFYFPLSMIEKGQEYPMYCRGDLIDRDGNKVKEIPPEECPLYIEIQNHLKNA